MLLSVWHHERDIVAMLEQALDQRDDGAAIQQELFAEDPFILEVRRQQKAQQGLRQQALQHQRQQLWQRVQQ